jgi:hypothetical protein
MIILTLFLRMDGDEQIFAWKSVAVSVIKNLNLPG